MEENMLRDDVLTVILATKGIVPPKRISVHIPYCWRMQLRSSCFVIAGTVTMVILESHSIVIGLNPRVIHQKM